MADILNVEQTSNAIRTVGIPPEHLGFVEGNIPATAEETPEQRAARGGNDMAWIVQRDATDPNVVRVVGGYNDGANFVPVNLTTITSTPGPDGATITVDNRSDPMPPIRLNGDRSVSDDDLNNAINPPAAPPAALAPTQLGNQLRETGMPANKAETAAQWIRERDVEETPEQATARAGRELVSVAQRDPANANRVNVVRGYMDGESFVPTSVDTIQTDNTGSISMGASRRENLPDAIPATMGPNGPMISQADMTQVVSNASLEPVPATLPGHEPGAQHPNTSNPRGNVADSVNSLSSQGGQSFPVRPDGDLENPRRVSEAVRAASPNSTSFAIVQDSQRRTVVLAGRRTPGPNGGFVVDQALVVNPNNNGLAPQANSEFRPGSTLNMSGGAVLTNPPPQQVAANQPAPTQPAPGVNGQNGRPPGPVFTLQPNQPPMQQQPYQRQPHQPVFQQPPRFGHHATGPTVPQGDFQDRLAAHRAEREARVAAYLQRRNARGGFNPGNQDPMQPAQPVQPVVAQNGPQGEHAARHNFMQDVQRTTNEISTQLSQGNSQGAADALRQFTRNPDNQRFLNANPRMNTVAINLNAAAQMERMSGADAANLAARAGLNNPNMTDQQRYNAVASLATNLGTNPSFAMSVRTQRATPNGAARPGVVNDRHAAVVANPVDNGAGMVNPPRLEVAGNAVPLAPAGGSLPGGTFNQQGGGRA